MKTFVAVVALSIAVAAATIARAEVRPLRTGAFAFDVTLTLPGTPEEIFGAMTGDISGWWDHTFSEHPKKLYIEPVVGGGFYEVFDDAGNGVRHAVVTYVDRPKILRIEGPLGLAGNAFQGVYTFTFEPVGSDSTKLLLAAQCAGHVEEAWEPLVEKVWRHFLIERFKPYVELGVHKKDGK
jgi:hypothetical protein